ncbi:MAG: extracellular solute-binding protein, partial [Clostridia bacterium]|nr:extracellular solute-binding protein [Clostridia bacterium]
MKKFLAMLLAVLMCFSLASAFADGEFSGETVTYWTAPFGDEDAAFFKKYLADWMARTGATVNIEVIPWDNYEEKYMTGVAGGTGPDVGYMYNEM